MRVAPAYYFLIMLLLCIGCSELPVFSPTPKEVIIVHQDRFGKRVDSFHWIKNNPWPLQSKSGQGNYPVALDIIQHLQSEKTHAQNYLTRFQSLVEDVRQELGELDLQSGREQVWISRGHFLRYQFQDKSLIPLLLEASHVGPEKIKKFDGLQKSLDPSTFRSIFPASKGHLSGHYAFPVVLKNRMGHQIFLHYKNRLIRGPKNHSDQVVWAKDDKGFFTVEIDKKRMRADRVWYYGLPDMKKTLVYREFDQKYVLKISESSSGRYLIVTSISKDKTVNRFFPLSLKKRFRPVLTRGRDIELADHRDGMFYFIRNQSQKDEASIFSGSGKGRIRKIFSVSGNIDSWQIFDQGFAFVVRDQLGNHIKLFSRQGKEIGFSDQSFSKQTGVKYKIIDSGLKGNSFVFSAESLKTPRRFYSFNTKSLALKSFNPFGGKPADASEHQLKRIEVQARDGAKIPITLFYKQNLELNGETPLLINVYGAYGSVIGETFSSHLEVLLKRGVVVGFAHVRGGGFKGRTWYEQGKLLQKNSGINDFIDAVKGLHGLDISSPQRTVAKASSAGGVILGASVNRAPQMFKGLLLESPFLDVLTSMGQSSFPLTQEEYLEWGDPTLEKHYHNIKSYSPYDNVVWNDYPRAWVSINLYDWQVGYWGAAKWVAKLRKRQRRNKRGVFLNIDFVDRGALAHELDQSLLAESYAVCLHWLFNEV